MSRRVGVLRFDGLGERPQCRPHRLPQVIQRRLSCSSASRQSVSDLCRASVRWRTAGSGALGNRPPDRSEGLSGWRSPGLLRGTGGGVFPRMRSSPPRAGRPVSRIRRDVDLNENGVFLQYGFLPGQETAGTVQQCDLQTLRWGIQTRLGEDGGDVQDDGDQPPEAIPGVKGLSRDESQSPGAKRIRAADHDPVRADGALDIRADLRRASWRRSCPVRFSLLPVG